MNLQILGGGTVAPGETVSFTVLITQGDEPQEVARATHSITAPSAPPGRYRQIISTTYNGETLEGLLTFVVEEPEGDFTAERLTLGDPTPA